MGWDGMGKCMIWYWDNGDEWYGFMWIWSVGIVYITFVL